MTTDMLIAALIVLAVVAGIVIAMTSTRGAGRSGFDAGASAGKPDRSKAR